MVMREIKKNLNKWKYKPSSIKMSTLPKLIYRFKVIPIKILARFFCWCRWDSKIYVESLKEKESLKAFFENEEYSRRNHCTISKLTYPQKSELCGIGRGTDQWKRKDDPEIVHTSMTNWFWTREQNQFNRKGSFFPPMVLSNWISISSNSNSKVAELNSPMKSKWITDSNVKYNAMQLCERWNRNRVI